MNKGNTIIFTTPYDSNERTGVIQEITSAGYLVNGVWYSKNDIKLKNILLDSRNSYDNNQLILG